MTTKWLDDANDHGGNVACRPSFWEAGSLLIYIAEEQGGQIFIIDAQLSRLKISLPLFRPRIEFLGINQERCPDRMHNTPTTVHPTAPILDENRSGQQPV